MRFDVMYDDECIGTPRYFSSTCVPGAGEGKGPIHLNHDYVMSNPIPDDPCLPSPPSSPPVAIHIPSDVALSRRRAAIGPRSAGPRVAALSVYDYVCTNSTMATGPSLSDGQAPRGPDVRPTLRIHTLVYSREHIPRNIVS